MKKDRTSRSSLTSRSADGVQGKKSTEERIPPDIWLTVGVSAFLLAGYFFSWLIRIMSHVTLCRSASRAIFSPEDCVEVSYLIPQMIMTISYGWGAMVIIAFAIMRRWGGVGAMTGILAFTTLVHLGTIVAKAALLQP